MANKETALRWLREDAINAKSAQASLLTAVSHARKAGASWAEIGAIIGTSKQAAQQRYGKLTPAPESIFIDPLQ